jgi:lipoprotein-releasing system permease protein
MFKRFEVIVAVRYLRAKRKDGFISVITWLSLIGITLGVATLITVMSVMNGFREEMLSKIMGVSGHVMVMPHPGRTTIEDYPALVDRISEAVGESMLAATPIPMVEAQVMVSSQRSSQGAMLRGIKTKDLAKINPVAEGILEGSEISELPRFGLIVGYKLLNRLGMDAGEEITITSPRGNITAFGTVPRIKNYPVVASFKTGMSIYDGTYIFADLGLVQNFESLEGHATQIDVFLKKPDMAEKAAVNIRKILPDNRIFTWRDINSSFVSALNVERNVMFLILTLIILVASFNIISSLVMLVKDKAKDIAVFKTLGANKTSIVRIFFLSGSIIGVIGTMVGTGLGIWLAKNIELVRQTLQALFGVQLFPDDVYFLASMPSHIEPAEVMAVAGMSLAISFLATFYPAFKAARSEPVEVLRYE